jgi:hypothetical protein
MDPVTYNGVPLDRLPTATPTDPSVTSPDDRQLIELLRGGKFAEAQRRFPLLYSNPHLGFLCQMTGHPAPADDQGTIPPLSGAELADALDFLEGPTKI